MNLVEVNFLNSFFHIFNARILFNHFVENKIFATVYWDDGDKQDIKWINKFNSNELEILTNLCDFLRVNNLIENDKILITENLLIDSLRKNSWSNEKIKKGIDCLMDLEIKMVDDGVETDSFYIHF